MARITVVCLLSPVQLFSDPIDCGPPGSSVHGISQAGSTGVGCPSLLQGIFPNQESTPLHWQLDSSQLSPGKTGGLGCFIVNGALKESIVVRSL